MSMQIHAYPAHQDGQLFKQELLPFQIVGKVRNTVFLLKIICSDPYFVVYFNIQQVIFFLYYLFDFVIT